MLLFYRVHYLKCLDRIADTDDTRRSRNKNKRHDSNLGWKLTRRQRSLFNVIAASVSEILAVMTSDVHSQALSKKVKSRL